MSAALQSIMMLGVFALAAGGFFMLRTGRDRTKAILMLAAALVLLGNVLILSL
jgi:hypothetical protein